MSARVTPLVVPGAAEAGLRRRVAELERDNDELVQRWLRANDACRKQRLMLRTSAWLVRAIFVDRLAVLLIGVLLGLAVGERLWP